MSKHTCHFEKLPFDIRPSIWGPEVYAFEHWLQHISLLFKGQKMAKRKRIRRCRTCGRYQIECPYCNYSFESDALKVKMTCPFCQKEIQTLYEENWY
ncbi:MAG: hypothetical protein IJM33_05395 [Bacteroidales bacterium]|nr:hypothetical protein [Bacteroidales bacterium]